MIPSLCEFCRHLKEVVSGKGSRFLLCQKSGADNRYPKYPPQPVVQCRGFDVKATSEELRKAMIRKPGAFVPEVHGK